MIDIDRRTVNVLMLSIGFMFLFTSFQTLSIILVTLLDSIKKDDANYTADPNIALAVVYVVFAVSNFLAPSVTSFFGPRLSILLGASAYALYVCSFFVAEAWVLYLTSFILGLGAAVIWTSQGMYLTQNSDDNTMSRNAGIFWAIFQNSIFLGNLFVFFKFQSKTHIDLETRQLIYTVLSAGSFVGIVILALLRPAVNSSGETVPTNSVSSLESFKRSFTLLTEKKMLLLCVSFWYTGALLSFATAIYSACIGFTSKIADNPKPLVGLSGVFFGLGEVVGGLVFGMMGKLIKISDRKPIIALGYVICLVCFALIFLNLPSDSPFSETNDVSILPTPIASLAIFCSFLLGLGDSCFNTQIYSIIGTTYKESSASAFGVFKFVQSIATSVAFIYSKYIQLHILLAILVGKVTLASILFCMVENLNKKDNDDAAAAVGNPSNGLHSD